MRALIVSVLLINSCAQVVEKNLSVRKISSASVVEDLSEGEQHIYALLENIVSTYTLKRFDLLVSNSPTAIEFEVIYHPKDHERIYGYTGIRKRNLQSLVVEQFLAFEEKKALLRGEDFEIEKTKRIFLRFSQDLNEEK